MTFRKEYKYKLNYSELAICKAQLMQLGMKQLYPPRTVNSIYLDTPDYKMVQESDEGIVPREKHRIRWYGKEMRFQYEIKTSALEGRFKHSVKCSKYDLDMLSNAGLITSTYGNILPSALISYQREYYVWDKLRITFDSNLHFSFYRLSKNFEFNDYGNVMEIKAAHECPDDYIMEKFPYQTVRFSKYARAFHLLG